MPLLRWQWALANGARVTAVIDEDARTETVSQGSRVLSQSARGAKAEGHTVVATPERADRSERPPIEAVVTFAPHSAICILRVDGHEVAPELWPVRERREPRPAARASGRLIPIVALAGIVVIAGVLFVSVFTRGTSDAKLDESHRAANGLFIAHFSADLASRPAVMPTGVGGVVLQDKAKARTIVLAASPLDEQTLRDPWALQQRFHEEALANLPKGDGQYEESARRDETCVGERGAVVIGRISRTSGAPARVWSCAFVHDGAAYIAMYMIADPGSTDERRTRAVIDATELTRLAEIGTSSGEPAGSTKR